MSATINRILLAPYPCQHGLYLLTAADRPKVYQWQTRRNQQQGGAHG